MSNQQIHDKTVCDSCGNGQHACTVHDFKMTPDHTPIEWGLCANCAVYWANLCLPPKTILKFRKMACGETYLTHDDFYDENGYAIQPRML